METLVPIVKYSFVITTGVAVAMIVRALVVLALGKARAARLPVAVVEE